MEIKRDQDQQVKKDQFQEIAEIDQNLERRVVRGPDLQDVIVLGQGEEIGQVLEGKVLDPPVRIDPDPDVEIVLDPVVEILGLVEIDQGLHAGIDQGLHAEIDQGLHGEIDLDLHVEIDLDLHVEIGLDPPVEIGLDHVGGTPLNREVLGQDIAGKSARGPGIDSLMVEGIILDLAVLLVEGKTGQHL